MIVKATFVSIWDDNSERIESSCKFNTKTKEATDIESVYVDELELNFLDEEHIVLPSGEVIKDFNYDGMEVVDGQRDQ